HACSNHTISPGSNSSTDRGVASAGLGDAVVGGALSVPDRTARSNSERAAPTGFGSLGRSTSSISVARRLAGEIAFGVGGGPSVINVNSHRTFTIAEIPGGS